MWIQSKPEYSGAFNEETGDQKRGWCIQIDGAGDEGPSHKEVVFLWTENHSLEGQKLTRVTTKYSGGSYLILNPVELMNGCLAQALIQLCSFH